MNIPDHITHYYLSDRKPFLNLSEANVYDLKEIVTNLIGKRKREEGHFRRYSVNYVSLRKKTEKKLRNLFIETGGKPQRTVPHYFVLGDSFWFKHLCSSHREVILNWRDIPSEWLSFTYPDSFVSMGLAERYSEVFVEKPYHGRVFRMHELEEIISTWGYPDDDFSRPYENYINEEFEKFIEVQLWSDEPVMQYCS